MEAVSAFDGGLVEADNLCGLQNTCGNDARSCTTINPQHKRWERRRSRMPPLMDSSAEIWPRRPKAAHNETGGVRLKCVRGEEGVISTHCLTGSTQMSELP